MNRILFLAILLILASCSKYSRIVKSDNDNLKLEAAIKYYEKKDYYRAFQLFEELLDHFRGTKEAERVYYYYAKCHYGQGDYMLAGYHFRNFCETFPNSQYREECFYMYAFCDYKESLPYYLDQQKTIDAINNLQLFINVYPGSKYVGLCNTLIDELRSKLHDKAYNSAKLWYQVGDYRAAMVACRNAVKDYPDIPYREELDYLTAKSAYLYARNSFEEKQKDRFNESLDYCREFIQVYPGSKYTRELSNIEKQTYIELNRLATSEKNKALQQAN